MTTNTPCDERKSECACSRRKSRREREREREYKERTPHTKASWAALMSALRAYRRYRRRARENVKVVLALVHVNVCAL